MFIFFYCKAENLVLSIDILETSLPKWNYNTYSNPLLCMQTMCLFPTLNQGYNTIDPVKFHRMVLFHRDHSILVNYIMHLFFQVQSLGAKKQTEQVR